MPDDPYRRKTLKTLGALASLSALGACGATTTRPGAQRYDRPLSHKPFAAPRISEDRIVRVIVGHRPFRPSGFVVRRERIDSKEIIHNYGHGGGGISLSWGSSALALRETRGLPVGDAANG